MGLVRVLHGMVGVQYQGTIVDESVFPDVDRLLELGAVERLVEPLLPLGFIGPGEVVGPGFSQR